MGVPKFFRYISERYPCLSEIVKEYQIPDFDNLYLDMNGIIHMCSHPDDGDPHFRISEEKIITDIFHYIEVLFRMIKPKKLFFMAVDGVAPRAKMNQQRARRFRSAKDAEKLEQRALSKGEVLPTDARFDSNCITPGTVFMENLHQQLKYFVVNKISTDKLWQNCTVILSGHETPGEGEHKIMDYIRYMRSQPGYDPKTRHCLYGLDADLIMLGLCTHEPHFSLLREEVKFGGKSTKRKSSPEEITFYLLHLSLMREYLELEFDAIRKTDVLSFGFDIEKVIDDWVLMGFLVGNDFIPNLPNLHIVNGALPVLYKTYMDVLPTFDGYINEGGTLNLERFEKFMKTLANIDLDNFEEQFADLKYFTAKTGRRPDGRQPKSYKQKDGDDLIEFAQSESDKAVDPDLVALIEKTDLLLGIDDDSEEDLDAVNLRDSESFKDEFELHRQDYYRNKLAYADVTSDVYRAQAECYVRAIQWNLNYYYNGVCSWSWFYPHHYAPYISDITGFADLKLEYDLGKPFQPYEQLLAVLPAASKALLPEPYHQLMTDEDSIIKPYYPEEFQTDINGKRAEWEAVVLIPFIDENILLQAMEPCNKLLSPEEVYRNTHGPMLICTYTTANLGVYSAPQYYPSVQENHASIVELMMEDVRVPKEKLVKGAYPGAKSDLYYLGFPTLKHLEYTHVLEKAGVKVHEFPSRCENMILKIKKKQEEDDDSILDAVARQLLGTTVYVAWPHLIEALVVTVSDSSFRYHTTGQLGHYNVEENKGSLAQTWQMEKDSVADHYMRRFGVDVGSTDILIHVKVMIGRKYVFAQQGRVTLEKEWAPITSAYPHQAIVQNISVHDEKYKPYKDVESVFPIGSVCFMLGQPYYGSMGEVRDSKESLKKGRIKVSMTAYEEMDLNCIKDYCEEAKVKYMDLHAASSKLSISKNLFSRITGSIFVSASPRRKVAEDSNKTNIGLNLKFTARNEEVPGYTQRKDGTWYYSDKAVNLVKAYQELCPKLFEYLQMHNENLYYPEDLFQDGKKLDDIISWMKTQPFYAIERRTCGSAVLDPEVVLKLEEMIDGYNKAKAAKDVVMQVKPHLLYKPDLNMGNIPPDATTTFSLYDRVVNIRESYTVPLGLRGTVIALHHSSSDKESEPLYDILFDEPFAGGLTLNCSSGRGYRLPKIALINKSHGRRQLEEKAGKPGQMIQSLNLPQNVNQFANQISGIPPLFPPQSSAFATWPNQAALRPPVLQPNANVNYNIASTNYGGVYKANNNFNVPPNLQQQNIPPRQQNFVPEFVKNEQQLQQQQQFFPRFDQQPRSFYNQNIKAGSSPQKQYPNSRQVVKGSTYNKDVKSGENWRQMPDNWRNNVPDANKNERRKVNTDFLKKMLKIDPRDSKQGPEKNSSSNLSDGDKITIQDIFMHARDKNVNAAAEIQNSLKLPNSPFSSVQLLSYYQSNGLGCPHYSYFDLPDKTIQARLVNPVNGQAICGKPAPSKLEASDSVASEVLKILSQVHRNEAVPAVSSACIPAPPKNWCQPKQSTETPRQSDKQKTVAKSASVSAQFVPLQAVRQHITKRDDSSPSKKNASPKDTNSSKTKESTKTNVNNETVVKTSNNEAKVTQKPRRERKMRIAANFQIKLEN